MVHMSVRVRDLMSSPVTTLSPHDDLATALAIEKLKHVRHLPVMEHGKLVGLISHRDLIAARPSSTLHLSNREMVALEHRVEARTIMQTTVRTTTPETLASVAAREMLDAEIGCLPVVDDERVVGIITEADLLRFLVQVLEKLDGGEPAPRGS